MATSGQTLNDRINAARYALAGQGLARCVCKATTEEVIGPKRKHLDYLIACTHEPNVSIPQLANLLIERTNHIYWVVVFKALVTVHHLMSYGNERFIQYLASSNYSFELSTFLDKTAARDFSMSTFIRRYSRYINEKALSYRLLAFDFCKVKRGNEGVLRVMPIDRLLKTLPILQNLLDALLEFDCSVNDLDNGVINACFMLLFRDLIGLFACHNDGIINLLNKYFTLNRKMCREAFELYKKFLIRMDKVSDFLRVAEVVGIDKDEIPDLRRAPSSLIDALEQHLQNLESNKKILKQQSSISNTSANNASNSASNSTGGKLIGELSMISGLTPPTPRRPTTPGGTTIEVASGSSKQTKDDFSVNSLRDEEVRKALEEEARVLSQYGNTDNGKNRTKSSSSNSRQAVSGGLQATNAQDTSPKFVTNSSIKSMDDLFGDVDSFGSEATTINASNGFKQINKIPSNGSPATFDGRGHGTNSLSAKRQPDVDSIKSTIKSATTTLEKSNLASNEIKQTGPKKASEDLFSLLDTSSIPTPAASTDPDLVATISSNPSKTTILGNTNPMSPFAPTPFDLTVTTPTMASSTQNGLINLKPGNPFPDIGGDLAKNPLTPSFPVGFNADPVQPISNSVFKSGPSTANYTNLGGLEGFGDLLQPMASLNKGSTSGANVSSSKPTFNSGSGMSSTGLFKGDLDSTLANLAQNLTFDGITKTKK